MLRGITTNRYDVSGTVYSKEGVIDSCASLAVEGDKPLEMR